MKTLGTVLTAAFLLFGCTTQTFLAESPSMEPTIPKGSKVKVDLTAYRNASPERFDIVAFHPPTNKEHIFIFRILALPGEHLSLGDSQVVINGKAISVPSRIAYSSSASGYKAKYSDITLGKNEFFLVGDNVAAANDSRFFGAIQRETIMGKVVSVEQRP